MPPTHGSGFSTYPVWMLGAIAVSALYWWRAGKTEPRLLFVFLSGLVSAFIGAKLVYLASEGWLDWGRPDWWQRWATGKSILGGLLLGYAGVEWAKRMLEYGATTGDRFAVVVPVGVFMGRLGCLSHGCCLGQACNPSAWYGLADRHGVVRWPVVPAELAFHAMALMGVLALAAWKRWEGQRFHAYLVAYGVFRLATEFQRDTPRLVGPISGYHLAALALALLGAVMALRRWRRRVPA